MQIAIGVQGQLHAFDLARALSEQGHEVLLLTNDPRATVRKHDLEGVTLDCARLNGLVARLGHRLPRALRGPVDDTALRAFGRHLRGRLRRAAAMDVLHLFSTVAEDSFADQKIGGLRTLLRASAHVLTQHALLTAEAARSGIACDRPTPWTIAREQREYALADRIVVMSEFARLSFVEHGIAASKLIVGPAGADVSRFGLSEAELQARRQRVESGAPLRVLTVGSWTAQKGAFDLAEVYRRMVDRCSFRFVGDIGGDARALWSQVPGKVERVARVAQAELRTHFAWGDVFLFPTIQDGYAIVLLQALMAGLPLIATAHCAAPELIAQTGAGRLIPVRSAEAMCTTLDELDRDRALLLNWLSAARIDPTPYGWPARAQQLVADFASALRR